MKRVLGWLAVIGLGVVLVAFTGYRVVEALARRSSAAERTTEGRAVVRTVVAEAREVGGAIQVVGTLRPANTVEVLPEVPGRVREVLVQVGDRVDAGDPLARLDPSDLRLARDQADGALASAMAGEDRARREAESAELLATTRSITENQLVAARAGLAAATGQRLQAKAARDLAAARLDDATLRTPIGGVVTRATIDVGQLVGPGAPAFQVQDDSAYEVEIGLDEASAYAVRIGESATVELLARTDLSLPGEVVSLSPSLDGQTRRAAAVVRLDPTEERLLTGSTVEVLLELPARTGVILVPDAAVVERGGDRLVRVLDAGNTVRHVTVVTGSRHDGETEVEGLEPGSRVVVQGPADLDDGVVVDPES